MTNMNNGLRIIKDFPKKGVGFIDINGLLENPACFTQAIDKFCRIITDTLDAETLKTAAIVSPQARGFLFAAPVAYQLALPLLTIRKKGKIPNNPYRFHITNEYDSYDMEMDGDLLDKYERYIYIDDILATGQTLASVNKALEAKNKLILLALHLTAVQDLQAMRRDNPDLHGLPMKEII